MLVHGDLDGALTTSQTEEMFTALTRLNRDAVFVRYHGEGHTIMSPDEVAPLPESRARTWDAHASHAGRFLFDTGRQYPDSKLASDARSP